MKYLLAKLFSKDIHFDDINIKVNTKKFHRYINPCVYVHTRLLLTNEKIKREKKTNK